MASSSVPAAKAGLLALLQARAGLSALQTAGAITWADPSPLLFAEAVWLEDAEFDDEYVAALRTVPHPKNETYVIPVHVFVFNAGNEVPTAVKQATEIRWWALAAEVEAAVRNAPTLGADTAGVYQAIVVGKRQQSGIYSRAAGWANLGSVSVQVKARI